jgi:hypothetical protein
MATIITKNSQTASAVPSAASLSVGELAVNTADGKLYTEHTGGVVKEIIPSTVVDGGITTAKIADGAITTAKIANGAVVEADIADGAVTTNKLSNSGVTAGSYGSASVVPVVTVDAKGRLTSVSTASIASSAPTTAQVLTATAGATAGDIGTYAFLGQNDTTNRTFGNTVSGSILYSASINGIRWCSGGYTEARNTGNGSTQRSGTWRLMGNARVFDAGCSTQYPASLYLRIS